MPVGMQVLNMKVTSLEDFLTYPVDMPLTGEDIRLLVEDLSTQVETWEDPLTGVTTTRELREKLTPLREEPTYHDILLPLPSNIVQKVERKKKLKHVNASLSIITYLVVLVAGVLYTPPAIPVKVFSTWGLYVLAMILLTIWVVKAVKK